MLLPNTAQARVHPQEDPPAEPPPSVSRIATGSSVSATARIYGARGCRCGSYILHLTSLRPSTRHFKPAPTPRRSTHPLSGKYVTSVTFADFSFPPFCGHLLQEFCSFTCSGVRSPQVIGTPESCGACSGYKWLQCTGRLSGAPCPGTIGRSLPEPLV